MKYKALVSFATKDFSMADGDVREISDKAIAKDLERVNYVEAVEKKTTKKKEEKK